MTEINNESFGGIDWATDEHAVCVVDTAGKLQDEFIVSHTDCGLRDPCRRLARNSVRRVAIERPDGSVVDTLMEARFEVVVVVSRSVKAFRQRYTTSGSKSDGSDAFVLADSYVLTEKIKELEAQMKRMLDEHPDAHIFRSLPRCGTVRAATMLAEIGDCRARFPDANSLACLAGVTPSTRASGRHRSVTFRWAANTSLRNVLCSFAGDSRKGNEWAAHRYNQLRAEEKRHPHAERITARTWTQIIWRCWQDHQPYHPSRRGALQALRQTTLT